MLFNSYKNFDDLYFTLNKAVIENPQKYVEALDLCSAYMPFTLLEIDSPDCTLDLGELYYTQIKFSRLINTYMDLDKFFDYKNKLKDCKGTSLTYYFNQIKKQIGNVKNNGPCIISFTLVRKDRGSEWNEMNIYYRTCELGRRFGVDLILFHVICKELDHGYAAMFVPRSSTANRGISISNCLIDENYRGEVHIIGRNNSNLCHSYKKGDRIASLLIFPIFNGELEQVEELSESNRGSNWNGSSGK